MENFWYRIKLTKLNELKFISHLDWQNLILKTLRRTNVNFALSEGFNPIPKISFSPALPIFIESECELVNFATVEPLGDDFREKFKASASENLGLLELFEYPHNGRKPESLDILVQWAKYEAYIFDKNQKLLNFKDVLYNMEKCLSDNDLFIEKVNKKGIKKNINYKKSYRSPDIKDDCFIFTLKTGQNEEIPSLRADEFLKKIFGHESYFKIKRTHFLNQSLEIL